MTRSTDSRILILPDEPGESELARLDRKIEQFLIAVITILGALPRVGWLDRPTIGMHEAAMYAMAGGSFASLLHGLQAAGASPLLPIFFGGWGIW